MRTLNALSDRAPVSNARSFYDAVADRFSDRGWVKSDAIRESTLSNFPDSRDATLLELGIGTGDFLGERSASIRNHIGLDISWNMLEICRTRLPSVILVQGNAEAIPLRNSSVDIVAGRKILRLCTVDAALREAYRVLRPDGLLYVVETCALSQEEKALIDEMIAISEPHQRPFHVAHQLTTLCEEVGFRISEAHTFSEDRVLTRGYCRDHYGMSDDAIDQYWRFMEDVPDDLKQMKMLKVVNENEVNLQINWIVLSAVAVKL